MKFKTFSNFPRKRHAFWQIVLLPTISVLRSVHTCDKYIAITLEFLFWSGTILIKDRNDKRTLHTLQGEA